MKAITRFLELGFALVLFFSAMVINLSAMAKVEDFQNLLRKNITQNRVVTKNQYDSTEEIIVSCDELRERLFGPLEYDFYIDGVKIEKEGFNPNAFDFTSIPDKKFRVTYQYDSNGNITGVTFTSL